MGEGSAAPADPAKLKIELYSYMTSGWVAFDDVSLVQVGYSTNLIANPGFESGTDTTMTNWTKVGVQTSFPATSYWRLAEEPPRRIPAALRLRSATLPIGNLDSDIIAVSPNTQYNLTTFAQGGIDSTVSNCGWILRAVFLDQNNNTISYTNVIFSQSITTTYQSYGGQITTPANAVGVRIQLFSFLTTGWIAFDDVSLVEVNTNTSYYYAGGQRVAMRRKTGGCITSLAITWAARRW